VQTIKQECLDHFIVFGEKHMSLLCSEFREHYHFERPHQGLGNDVLRQTMAKKRDKQVCDSNQFAQPTSAAKSGSAVY